MIKLDNYKMNFQFLELKFKIINYPLLKIQMNLINCNYYKRNIMNYCNNTRNQITLLLNINNNY